MDSYANVVVAGSVIVDYICYVRELPKPGETVIASKRISGFGGKGANQAVCAARLGASTAMVGKIGGDSIGEDYLKNFTSNRVNIEHLTVAGSETTGVAMINVAEGGENSIVVVPGANACLSESDVDDAENLIAKCSVLLCQNEIPINSTRRALSLAKKYKVTTLLNVAPAHEDFPADILKMVDILCVNETEAEIISGRKCCKSVEEACLCCKQLLEFGCELVIITLGQLGAVFATKSEPARHVPATKVEQVVDTTGAGDAFVGTLAYITACEPHLSLEEKIMKCCEVAADTVTKPGTQSSYPFSK